MYLASIPIMPKIRDQPATYTRLDIYYTYRKWSEISLSERIYAHRLFPFTNVVKRRYSFHLSICLLFT